MDLYRRLRVGSGKPEENRSFMKEEEYITIKCFWKVKQEDLDLETETILVELTTPLKKEARPQ